jgi:hypothetical protein
MKNIYLTCLARSEHLRFVLVIVLTGLIFSGGCTLSASPSKTVEALCRTVERGDVERAETFFSSGLISRLGIGPLKTELTNASLQLKNHAGIKSIKVLKEDVVGDVAEVTVEITRGNGDVAVVHYKLTKEQGVWKVDGVTSDPAGSVSEPLHPERAVEDVVKWAIEAGVANIKNWSEKRQTPPICRAPAVDRTTLPDEVKYHDVNDPKVTERLMSALDPVLKLVGCSSNKGVLLYKGSNVYAGTLGGGQIAITPGDSYFVGPPPEEKIFHSLAELRIFLAREVFRQMIPVERQDAGLNEADMLLRRDLKLNYLAGTMSLAIDHDPTILDRVVLDLDLYAKPVGIMSGTQGIPSLQQIEDIFGAVKQEYQQQH